MPDRSIPKHSCEPTEPEEPTPVPTPATCVLPPVDVTHCNVDADCAVVFKGCWCGARPVLAANKSYVKAVQTCEDLAEAQCAIACARSEVDYSVEDTTTQDLKKIVARCDTTGLIGACVARLQP